ncbi:hypothetical protein DE146DRAFT_230062 [Phaeosphaeria sp. MPI-PUGE-AT-0046c]|nr:hypothetical protein DE146DRAFT_230062 [Phaeosphaeria sp. MPI-PUGE-AT-0046c]
MSGYYPGHNIPPQYYNIDPNAIPSQNIQHAPPLMIPQGSYAPGIPENPFHPGASGPFVPYPESHLQQPYVEQYEDVPGSMGPTQGANARARRRPVPGEQVKHRRTRSGCFTCRQRRVKCDENHPTCERCRKGQRECIYPDTQSSQKSTRSGSKSGKASALDNASSPEDLGESDKERLPSIADDEEDDEYRYDDGTMSGSQDLRDSPHTPGSTLDQSTSSPSTTASSTVPPIGRPPISRKGSTQTTAIKIAPSMKNSSSKTLDVQFYLDYFRNHITIHHYSLKQDPHNFLKGDFLTQALKFEPLKYAVAGYAAYFHTLSQPDGRMSTFLHFYNESVSRLRAAITKNKKQGLATFLTILQLASIEELLGDWVNLMGHQKAAFDMLNRLYTPKSITQSDFLLKISMWYIRFDLFVGFQSGGEAVLSRDWFEAVHECYQQKARDNPDDLGIRYEERFAYSRLVAKDSNDLFARTQKGLISPQDFMAQLPVLRERVESLRTNLPEMLTDSQCKVRDMPGTQDPNDIVDPYESDVMWGDRLFTTNFLMLDIWGIIFMFNISEAMALRKPFSPETTKEAYKAVQLYEAMCAYPEAPNGTMLEAQVSFAIAFLFLPKDQKTTQWCRRTFAKIEASGYIYSDVLRNRMLESMGEGPSDWWLPEDEGCPRIIRTIKDFIKERTTAPKDQVSDDLREMRGIFNSLTISDSPNSDTMTVTSAEGSQSTM